MLKSFVQLLFEHLGVADHTIISVNIRCTIIPAKPRKECIVQNRNSYQLDKKCLAFSVAYQANGGTTKDSKTSIGLTKINFRFGYTSQASSFWLSKNMYFLTLNKSNLETQRQN